MVEVETINKKVVDIYVRIASGIWRGSYETGGNIIDSGRRRRQGGSSHLSVEDLIEVKQS